MSCRWIVVLALAGLAAFLGAPPALFGQQPAKENKTEAKKPKAEADGGFFTDLLRDAAKGGPRLPPGVPAKVGKVLAHIDKNDEAPEGYQGGRNFGNFERLLPRTDKRGRQVRYREWDVNPLRPGVNRGAERLVTGSDGSAYYTADHYDSFTRIR